MNKSENTLMVLEAALERIIQGQLNVSPKSRKLSVRAVEEEANLGNGEAAITTLSLLPSKSRQSKNLYR